MKPLKQFVVLFLAITFTVTLLVENSSSAFVSKISRAEAYERFHDVLHPLQHEALPRKNFAEIRRRSGELFTRGRAIVKLGVGQAPKRNRAEFAKALSKFSRALAAFRTDARSGSDSKLEKAFSDVHDLYEELDALVAEGANHLRSTNGHGCLSCRNGSARN